MKRILLLSACLMLTAGPVMAQAPSDDRRGGRDGGVEDLLRDLGDGMGRGGGASRGALFFLRSGDATIAVRCDPLDNMKSCVDAASAFMEKARSMAPGAATPPKP
jgi:hypothetical protein